MKDEFYETETESGTKIRHQVEEVTPEDGWQKQTYVDPDNPLNRETVYRKGHFTTHTFETDDPRIVRIVSYSICALFLVIGIFLLAFRQWLFGIAFIVIPLITLSGMKRQIDANAERLAQEGRDVTIDSPEEAKQVMGDFAEEVKEGVDDAAETVFKREDYERMKKISLPIIIPVLIFVVILFGFEIGPLWAVLLGVITALAAWLFYFVLKKICCH